MTTTLPTLAGFIAIGLFVLAYAMVNLGIWNEKQIRFHIPNFLGSVLMIYSLMYAWNLPMFILETCWMLISIYGMWKASRA